MTLLRLLMLTYPRSWRVEYGAELEDLLDHRRLTPSLAANVARSGIRQHLRRDEPWKLCSFALSMWTVIALFLAVGRLVESRTALLSFYLPGQLFLTAAAPWSVWRKKVGLWRATVACAKASAAPVALMMVWAPAILLTRYGISTPIGGHNVYYWIWRNLQGTVNIDLVFGLPGVVLAFLLTLRRQHHAASAS